MKMRCSRYTQPPRNSRGDLEKRIELAEKRLNVAWDDYNVRLPLLSILMKET